MERISIGIPVFREQEWLPQTLESLNQQSDLNFDVWICVNQPDYYWGNPEFAQATTENLATLAWLTENANTFKYEIHFFDAVHSPQAPPKKFCGVGWARRYLFDRITTSRSGYCISLDADTILDSNYVNAVRNCFHVHPNAIALAAPYYHPLPQNQRRALHLLRYEIYLRYYQLSLWRIGSPYAFLPLGSAMCFTSEAYRRIGGIPRRNAGEDFYFLQQLRKVGPVARWINSTVKPASRFSDRVPFGTGLLLNESNLTLQEARFPFYDQISFNKIRDTYRLFRPLYQQALELPMKHFINARMRGMTAFDKMRANYKKPDRFLKACHEKLDALRILQFLRFDRQVHGPQASLAENFEHLLNGLGKPIVIPNFEHQDIQALNSVRDRLCLYERQLQQQFMADWRLDAKW